MLKKFNLYAGIRQNNYNLEVSNNEMFATVEEALLEAKFFAEELYEKEPFRDVTEIMKEDKISEEKAYYRYNKDMNDSIIWRVEEIIEDSEGKTIEVINHNPPTV